jgi:hypothetical protein
MTSLSLLILVFFLTTCYATNVKWTAGKHDPKNRAATAPRSQKYWDKHNIKRPDYGKTDAEIRAERGETSDSTRIAMLLVLGGLAYGGYHIYITRGADGFRWGGGRKRLTEEEERQARLARFENIGAKEE